MNSSAKSSHCGGQVALGTVEGRREIPSISFSLNVACEFVFFSFFLFSNIWAMCYFFWRVYKLQGNELFIIQLCMYVDICIHM